MTDIRTRFDRLNTPTKLVLFLTLALLPLGLVLAWNARTNISETSRVAEVIAERKANNAARAIESLIARNSLALKVAATGSIAAGSDACTVVADSLDLTPAMAKEFSVRSADGSLICSHDQFTPARSDKPAAPSAIRLWVSPNAKSVFYRVGLIGGSATGSLGLEELRGAVLDAEPTIRSLAIVDGDNRLDVFGAEVEPGESLRTLSVQIGNRQLQVEAAAPVNRPGIEDQLSVFIPFLMFVIAALLSWYLVRRLLLVPATRLQHAVEAYRPGSGSFVVPERLGGAAEVRLLGESFAQAVERLEESESQMSEALVGQQKLVREVHHRVKNNLQVIASMLSIHGRNASTPESEAAYAAIGRRVDALSVVHRNHFAEVEESRGIAMRPMLVELASTLKASAPDHVTGMEIKLDTQALNTTQDTAIAASFFITEVVEFALLGDRTENVEIELSRISELSARLTVATDTLIKNDSDDVDSRRQEFDRVVAGLARQLRSPLEEKLGRLSVVLPVFPEQG